MNKGMRNNHFTLEDLLNGIKVLAQKTKKKKDSVRLDDDIFNHKSDEDTSLYDAIIKLIDEVNPKLGTKTEPITLDVTPVVTPKEEPKPVVQPSFSEQYGDILELPLDYENVFNTPEITQQNVALEDTLIKSLQCYGRVDIEYMAALCGLSLQDVVLFYRNILFQNPLKWEQCFYKGWETRDEYCSGNVVEKYHVAQEANKKYRGWFDRNITVLKKIQPHYTKDDMYVTLGTPWIPSEIIDAFICHMMKVRSLYGKTTHDYLTGTWHVYQSQFTYAYQNISVYGTRSMAGTEILERSLNQKPVEVYDSKKKNGKTVRTLNHKETLLAQECQKKMIAEFEGWIWTDPNRTKRLESIYNDRYGSLKTRQYDGSYLTFPGMNPTVHLLDYQKNAVMRILTSPNTLLAHDVGSGKTYEMVAAGMELRRLGRSKKNMYVVPNNIISQWYSLFKTIYPKAKVLCIEPTTFTPDKRFNVLKKMAQEEWDGIIMGYSSFNMIPLSQDYLRNDLKEQLDKITLAMKEQPSISALKRLYKSVKEKMEALDIAENKGAVTFDKLGIDALFVDEAHNFKNVNIRAHARGTLGISASGSKVCDMMMRKVEFIERNHNGGNVIFATGTPITNSITDAFVLQRYLQSGELKLMNLDNFDSWCGMFASKQTQFEVSVDTAEYKMATRFSAFHNLPLLTTMLASFADFHHMDKGLDLPDFKGYQDVVVPKSAYLERFLKDVSQRADKIHSHQVKPEDDNMLKLTIDGRLAALDLRLVHYPIFQEGETKAYYAAEHIADIYHHYYERCGTQLVFIDSSTPKEGFNIYHLIKEHLIQLGVKEEEIEFIHNAKTESQKEKMLKRLEEGELRVLLGSTFKLGMGVNVQKHLIALHHVDIPWRPADMVQREGRIIRQGNLNKEVFIYRYITEGSFDAYSWQLLETKQSFISHLLSGDASEKSAQDVDDTVLNYAEVKALAIGNPLIKERVEVANELSRYKLLRFKAQEAQKQQELAIAEKKEQYKELCHRLEALKLDVEYNQSHSFSYTKEEINDYRLMISQGLENNILQTNETLLGEYRGYQMMLPANMGGRKKYLWLVKEGRYRVEMGDSAIGTTTRLDNYIDGMAEDIALLEQDKKEANKFIRDAKKTMSDVNYDDTINELAQKLKDIDDKLNVNK